MTTKSSIPKGINFAGWHTKWMDARVEDYLKFKRRYGPWIRRIARENNP